MAGGHSAPGAKPSFLATVGWHLFQWRDYTPVPLLIVFWLFAEPRFGYFHGGVGCMLLGEGIRLRSLRFITSRSRTRGETPGDHLITAGPFARVRNPLYLGNLWLTIGAGLLSGHPEMALIAVALFFVQYVPIVRWEESLLTERFGETYRDYCRNVPRWRPRWRPMETPETELRPLWQVLRTERGTLLSAGAVILLFGLKWWLRVHGGSS